MNNSSAIRLGGHGGYATFLPLKYANRHCLISGATGSGKTVTLQLLAEQFSKAGVPTILPDIKGDLIGLAKAGEFTEKLGAALERRQQAVPQWSANPVRRWSVGTTSSSLSPLECSLVTLGPHLLTSLLGFNETQSSLLQIVFKIARDRKFSLVSLGELIELLSWIQGQRSELVSSYGLISDSSLSVIMRELLVLDEQAVGSFISGTDTPLPHLLATHNDQSGVINLIDSSTLLRNPELYASMFCWLVTRLYEELPEVGDLPLPRLVIFIDEAHLLFETLGKGVQENLQRSIRLIRSRGVGVFFASQLPSDIPDSVLSQLGHRVQHVLRAFTPKDKKAVAVAAQTMRENPAFDMLEAITSLAPGEALVSCIDENGHPSVTSRIWLDVPSSHIGVPKTAVELLPPYPSESKSSKRVRAEDSIPPKSTLSVNSNDSVSTVKAKIKAPNKGKHRERILNGILKTFAWLLRI